MRLDILGCRGSTPAPGPDFVRYGGDTSCVAVTGGDESAPSLILDAGTGLRHLGGVMWDQVFGGTILLSHLHWDHTHGLPFSPPIDRPAASVRLLLPEQGEDPSELMARVMSPPHFPITVEQLRCQWEIGSISVGDHEVERFEVSAAEIEHKGGTTFGYRVSDRASAIAYLPDHSVGDDIAVELARGADLLIHDAQYTTEEQEQRADFGHSSIEQAIDFAQEAEVGALLLFHHDFNRTDEDLDELMSDLAPAEFAVSAAVQGASLTIG